MFFVGEGSWLLGDAPVGMVGHDALKPVVLFDAVRSAGREFDDPQCGAWAIGEAAEFFDHPDECFVVAWNGVIGDPVVVLDGAAVRVFVPLDAQAAPCGVSAEFSRPEYGSAREDEASVPGIDDHLTRGQCASASSRVMKK